MTSPPINDEASPIIETPPFVPCDEGHFYLSLISLQIQEWRYHLGDFLKGGDEEHVAGIGKTKSKGRGEGISSAAGKGTKHSHSKPGWSIAGNYTYVAMKAS